MKKVLAVFMAILMTFSCFAIVVFAEDDVPTTVASDEKTTRNIQNDQGLVVPINFDQFKMSFIFKLFEKLIMWIMNIFAGDNSGNVDASIATDISSIGEDVLSAIEEGSEFLSNNAAA